MSAKLNRREKRNEAKLSRKMYTYDECKKLVQRALIEQASRYDMIYTTASVCALNASPFKFGKKRVAEFVNMFFGQVMGLKDGTIDVELMHQTCKKVGISLEHKDNRFLIHIGDEKALQK